MRGVATSATTAAVFVRALDVGSRNIIGGALGQASLRHHHGSGDDNDEKHKENLFHLYKPPE
jgi:hypothetical protein